MGEKGKDYGPTAEGVAVQGADADAKPKAHKHVFTALWWHFGPYGQQGVHVHSCFTEGCDRVLVGEGHSCKKSAAHHRETLVA